MDKSTLVDQSFRKPALRPKFRHLYYLVLVQVLARRSRPSPRRKGGIGDTGNGTGPEEAAWPQIIPAPACSHRIYPDGHAVAVISGATGRGHGGSGVRVRTPGHRPSRLVCIDLAGLSFCDARGLRTLIGAVAHALVLGLAVSLSGARPAIVKIMRITGVDANFPELCQPGSRTSQGSRGRGHSARNTPSPIPCCA